MWPIEQLKQFYNWMKKKIKKIAIAVGIIGVATASTILLQPQPIPADYQLKADKTKVLYSEQVDWNERQPDGSVINKGKIVKYDYVSSQEVGQGSYGKLKEDLSMRTGNAQFFNKGKIIIKGKEREQWVGKFYSGMPFIKEADGKWYQTETATTTIDAFSKQTAINLFEKTFGIYALSTTTYAGAGDGDIDSGLILGWATWRAYAGAGATASPTVDAEAVAYTYCQQGCSTFEGARGLLPFYTAGIPTGATITTSTLYAYTWTKTDALNDGLDYGAIMETFQADHTTLVGSDFNDVGYGSTTETAGRASATDIVIGSNKFDITDLPNDQYNTWSLNATGLGWIKINGQTSTCGASITGWTCLGIREGHDIENVAYSSDGTADRIRFRFSEYAGTASDPYLIVGYTTAVTGGVKVPDIITF